MKRFYVMLAMVTSFCGSVVAQDLPPEILADQYLLEATKALEEGKPQKAIAAFRKIEALNIEPPLEFRFFYGKLLVEHSTSLDDLLKGQSLLKQYVIRAGRKSEHYTPTLELLSAVTTKALFLAAKEGDAEVVKALIAAGADVNEKNKEGNTPLYKAATEGQTEVVKALIAAGADVNEKDGEGYAYTHTPLFKATRQGDTEAVKTLIAAGADVNVKITGSTTLKWAASDGHTEIVKALIAAGVDVNEKDGIYGTLLHRAAVKGHTEIVKALIAAGADVNVKDKENDYTPLHWAAYGGRTEIVKALIAAGADVNAKNENLNTPLDLATREYHYKIIRILKAAGGKSSY